MAWLGSFLICFARLDSGVENGGCAPFGPQKSVAIVDATGSNFEVYALIPSSEAILVP